MKIYDISPLISERIGVFPGDSTFKRTIALDMEQGHNIGLSAISTTLHVGAHADAPNHYKLRADGIDKRELSRYLGKCEVIHVSAERGERVGSKHITKKPRAPRVLIRTKSFPDPDQWNSDFCSYDPALIEDWAKAGVHLIGIDTPSIDPETSKDLPSHTMVAKYDLCILEGLILDDVPEGLYTLVALPLKIENADASPVRAVLIDDSGRAFP